LQYHAQYERPLEGVYPESYLLGGLLLRSGAVAAGSGSAGLKAAGAVIGGVANYGSQTWFNEDQPVDWLSVGLSSVTGWSGASTTNIVPLLKLNTGAALVDSAMHGQNPGNAVAGAMGGTVLGWGLGSLTRSGATWLGNVRPSTVNANYTKYWQTYGYSISRYIPELEQAAPYLGIGFGGLGTEFGGAKVQSEIRTHDIKK
jgi:hypothetical protein